MTGKPVLRSLLGATILLSAYSAAHAMPVTLPFSAITPGQTYYYATSSSVPAATGTLAVTSNATNAKAGGLCEVGFGACTSATFSGTTGPIVSGTGTNSVAGSIEIDTPLAIAYYQLTVTVTNKTSFGDIYDIIVNGSSLGTTTVTTSASKNAQGATVTGSGTFSTILNGGNNQPIYISITDLLQQYLGVQAKYDLPGLLGHTDLNSDSLGSANADTQSLFTLQATLAPVPEPASLSVLAAGTFALGFARRRSRAKRSPSAS